MAVNPIIRAASGVRVPYPHIGSGYFDGGAGQGANAYAYQTLRQLFDQIAPEYFPGRAAPNVDFGSSAGLNAMNAAMTSQPEIRMSPSEGPMFNQGVSDLVAHRLPHAGVISLPSWLTKAYYEHNPGVGNFTKHDLVHEIAHNFQDPQLFLKGERPKFEGGAEAFAQLIARTAAKKAGIPYSNNPRQVQPDRSPGKGVLPGGEYGQWAATARKNPSYVLRGQFNRPVAPKPSLSALLARTKHNH